MQIHLHSLVAGSDSIGSNHTTLVVLVHTAVEVVFALLVRHHVGNVQRACTSHEIRRVKYLCLWACIHVIQRACTSHEIRSVKNLCLWACIHAICHTKRLRKPFGHTFFLRAYAGMHACGYI